MPAEEISQSFQSSGKSMLTVMVCDPLIIREVKTVSWEDGVVWFGTEGNESLEGFMCFPISWVNVVAVLSDDDGETHLVSNRHQGVSDSLIVPLSVMFNPMVLDLYVDGAREPGLKGS